jgi:hypothetical protein
VTTRSRTVALVLSTVVVGATVLSGCGADEATDAASPSSAASQSNSGTVAAPDEETGDDGPTAAPSAPADADPDTAEASSDANATVSEIRLGRHEGFDRVVFEVGGSGTPGWDVRYVDQAASQGSGDAVEVGGDAVLQVTLTGMGYPYDTGVEEYSGGTLNSAATEVVREVVWDATYEGTSVAFVGTTGELPFRVYALEGPARVVVEVADAG